MSSNNNKSDFKNKLMLPVCIAGVIASIWGMAAMSELVNSKAPKGPEKETFVNNHENVAMVDMLAEDYGKEPETEETEEETVANAAFAGIQMFTGETGAVADGSEERAPEDSKDSIEDEEEAEETEANAAFSGLMTSVDEKNDDKETQNEQNQQEEPAVDEITPDLSIVAHTYHARFVPLPTGGSALLKVMSTTEELTSLPEYMSWENMVPGAELVERWDPEHKVDPALFNAHTINLSTVQTIGEAAAFYAETRLGKPYSQARRDSGEAYDCSSLVYWSYIDAGFNIGARTSYTMAEVLKNRGCELTSGALMAGDLIFYSYEANDNFMGIDHVAMVVGNGHQIEASSTDGQVIEKGISFYHAVMIARPVAAGGRVSTQVFSNIQALLSEPMVATPAEMEEMGEETAETTPEEQ